MRTQACVTTLSYNPRGPGSSSVACHSSLLEENVYTEKEITPAEKLQTLCWRLLQHCAWVTESIWCTSTVAFLDASSHHLLNST